MSVYIAKISLHVLDEDISENGIRLFEKMVTNVGSTSMVNIHLYKSLIRIYTRTWTKTCYNRENRVYGHGFAII